jgi:hypothetical protein
MLGYSLGVAEGCKEEGNEVEKSVGDVDGNVDRRYDGSLVGEDDGGLSQGDEVGVAEKEAGC